MENPRDVLVAFLHDPPDKAFEIKGHEARALRYLETALGDAVSEAELKDVSDVLAATAERLPAPHWTQCTISWKNGHRRVHHPLSAFAPPPVADTPWTEAEIDRTIAALVDGIDVERRFLLLWRRLPEQLAHEHGAWFARLPADTRVPDHTLWHHLDTTAALKAARAGESEGAAFLSFSLGPVQSFIAAARSVRDLWSGSMILSWLTFHAMLPVVEQLGPTALIYPSLRGLPWLDRWLIKDRNLKGKIDEPSVDLRMTPCLPNRFLALVPWGHEGQIAVDLAERCREAVKREWMKMAEAVKRELDQRLGGLPVDWSKRWPEQVENFFEYRTAVLPWRECASDATLAWLISGSDDFDKAFPDAAAVRKLAGAIPDKEQPRYGQSSAGGWQAKVELSARLMQAQRSIRHVPPAAEADSPGQEFPPKCSLLGSYEQMGPAGLDDSREFWEQASKDDRLRLREGERFCAIALVKRFCGPWFFVDQLDLAADDLRYEDTATVAAAKWLKSACIDPREIRRTHREHRWSGQWLHWPTPDFDPDDRCPQDIWDKIRSERRDSKAPAYYSVLMMDGDNLGDWLRGENSPLVGEIMHPDLVSYYRRLTERSDVPEDAKKFVHEGLRTKRPVGPALHAAISEALANFALHFVPNIVARHGGTLIYAGGDDVLALLPTTTSLACALELRDTFRADWKTDESTHTERLLMGSRATVSAGLAVVHYKEDLRFALDEARKAEKTAKDAGRDALQITVCRRSGEHATALCPWGDNEDDSNWTDQERFSCVRTLQSWIGSFIEGASDRWAFHLRGELPTLQALPEDAMKSEIRRQINHAEEKTREAFPPDAMSAVFGAYRQSLLSEKRRPQDAFFTKRFPTREEQDRELTGRALKGFITLCQSASFLARGRDE